MDKQFKNTTKHKPYTTLIALLVLVALFTLLMNAAGTVGYQNASAAGDSPCGTPTLCTRTPTNTPAVTPTVRSRTPTSTPQVTSTNTAPTSTPIATDTPTEPATPTNTPTDIVPTSTPTAVPPASITVYNTAAFFVQYYVSYNLPGLPLQSLYSGVFNVNQGVTLTIPGEATNVGVLVQHYTGITGWQTTCTRAYAQATSAVIIVSGTTFSPTCTGG